MKFERDDKRASFEIPDRPTVRQQLEYFGATAGANGKEMLIRFWTGAQTLITNWESDALPDYRIDLDKIDDPAQADIITWAGLQVMRHMNGLEEIPKNS